MPEGLRHPAVPVSYPFCAISSYLFAVHELFPRCILTTALFVTG